LGGPQGCPWAAHTMWGHSLGFPPSRYFFSTSPPFSSAVTWLLPLRIQVSPATMPFPLTSSCLATPPWATQTCGGVDRQHILFHLWRSADCLGCMGLALGPLIQCFHVGDFLEVRAGNGESRNRVPSNFGSSLAD
jgi:hypothetical protein